VNRFVFKIIAAATMVIDHFGLILLDDSTLIYSIFRIIGRVSFVMFAYMIAEGFFKTKDVKKYLLRLGLAAIILEVFIIIYYFISDVNMILSFNILWTLFAGLLSLYLFYHKNNYLKILVLPIVIISELFFSYGSYGVLMIIFFGMYQSKVKTLISVVFLNLIYITYPLAYFIQGYQFARFPVEQWFSLGAIVFIFLYNGLPGKYKLKWFFYLFYPGHLLLLYLIDILRS